MLSGAGLRNHAALAHSLGQQDLAHRVVDFVRAGVQEVFPFEIDARAAQRVRQTLREVEWGGPSAVALQVVGQLFLEQAILPVAFVFLLELIQCRDERLRDIAAAVLAEANFLGDTSHSAPPLLKHQRSTENADCRWQNADC